MGLFDAIKNRLGREPEDEYQEDEQGYGDEHYEDENQDAYDAEAYYDDAPEYPPVAGASSRDTGSFSTYTPLVSMSDVRSQELPPLTATSPVRAYSGSSSVSLRDSLPYVRGTAQDLDSEQQSYVQQGQGFSGQATGPLLTLDRSSTRSYATGSSSDPLLKRHSLSSTGDFAATSPAYYASRSGTGHVRPAGQPRKTNKYREVIVIRPESYAEAEQVAINLRRGNAVVLMLIQARPELAKRILDFSFGAAAYAEGRVESIGERIYALTRDHALTETEVELLQNRGIL